MKDKVVLVTGAAGGIGSAMCRRFAAEGARVVLMIRNNVEGAQALLREMGQGDHLLVQADVADASAITQAAERVREKYGKLDVLVNNAGMTRQVAHADLDALDDDLIDEIFRTNWRGAFACVRAFLPLLVAAAADDDGRLGSEAVTIDDRQSVVINISSIAGTTGLGSNVAYCASKAALDSMTRSLARALAPGIRVVSVAPGWVEGEYAKRMNAAMLDEQKQKTPLKKLASAEDVAEAVYAVAVHLKHTTGCIIPVDGGRPLG